MATLHNNTSVKWDLQIKIIESNSNALQIKLAQPIDQALDTTHTLYLTDLDALEKFASDLLFECRTSKSKLKI
jgi:hypothetical protein